MEELDGGTFTMTGDINIEFELDGAEDCDGCVKWSTEDQHGTYCSDMGTGDTGDWDTGW